MLFLFRDLCFRFHTDYFYVRNTKLESEQKKTAGPARPVCGCISESPQPQQGAAWHLFPNSVIVYMKFEFFSRKFRFVHMDSSLHYKGFSVLGTEAYLTSANSPPENTICPGHCLDWKILNKSFSWIRLVLHSKDGIVRVCETEQTQRGRLDSIQTVNPQ